MHTSRIGWNNFFELLAAASCEVSPRDLDWNRIGANQQTLAPVKEPNRALVGRNINIQFLLTEGKQKV